MTAEGYRGMQRLSYNAAWSALAHLELSCSVTRFRQLLPPRELAHVPLRLVG